MASSPSTDEIWELIWSALQKAARFLLLDGEATHHALLVRQLAVQSSSLCSVKIW